jgi:hypothetical protein
MFDSFFFVTLSGVEGSSNASQSKTPTSCVLRLRSAGQRFLRRKANLQHF